MNGPQPTPAQAAPAPEKPAIIQTGLNGSVSNLAKVLRAGQFAVCIEVSPPVGPNPKNVERQIATLKGFGDAYNVTDNQSAMVHCSSLAVSIMLKQAGMEPIVQFACRDRNRLAMQADALGASIFGINTVLAISGDHPKYGDHPDCKAVYDMDSMNVLRMFRMMRDNQVFENGEKIPVRAPDLFIGAVENPFAPPYEFRPYRVAKKIVAGAQFIQTQLIYNVERFEEFMKRVVDMGLHEKIAILAGVGPMRSVRVAEYMSKEVAGMDVPQALVDKMRPLSKEDGEKFGIDLCCEIANKVRNIEGVRGLHIMAVSWPDAVPKVAQNLGLFPRPVIEEPAPPAPPAKPAG
jgi:methylenetetrahydrofolate reductase (NADPH)